MMSSLSSLLFSLIVAVSTPTGGPPQGPGARVEPSVPLVVETGTLSPPLGDDLAASVYAWALINSARYGLGAGSTLERAGAFSTWLGASFHFAQLRGDLEVYGAKLVITVDEHARVVAVTSSLDPAPISVNRWAYSADEALRRAASHIPLPLLRADGSPTGATHRFLFRVGDALHTGYLCHVPSLDLSKNWYVAIDAVTGKQLFIQNRVHTASLTAQVYPVSPGGLDSGVGRTPTVSRELVHDDGGSMVAPTCDSLQPDGGFTESANVLGELCGTQLTSYNCCPSAGCRSDAGAARYSGTTSVGGFSIDFDVAVCDRLRRASSVTNSSGDYVYMPRDPPQNRSVVERDDEANSDAFAEVHAFYHANQVYDWVRELSVKAGGGFPGQAEIMPFTMRDERRSPPQKMAVWTNFMFPNYEEILSGDMRCVLNPPCRANTLLRFNNAAFFPRESFAELPLPGLDTGVDTLLIFQGDDADAAYDATVVHHEMGHGVVYATAELLFDSIAFDNRSANNETGALHEAFADYIAAAFGQDPTLGPYFGPRASSAQSVPGIEPDSYLRTLNNSFSCPGVLWGEVHQDSQHVASALWNARTTLFRGNDSGHTFDAAFYAMLVALTPNADFSMMAAVMAQMVTLAFPESDSAAASLTAVFSQKGVIGCSKVLDVSSWSIPAYYGIASASSGMEQSFIPGPLQFKVPAPWGARQLTITASSRLAAPLPGASLRESKALAKVGQPITFTRQGNTVRHDADVSASGTTKKAMRATLALDVPCGKDAYVSVGTVGGGSVLQYLEIQITPRAFCDPVAQDAGVELKTIPAISADGTVSTAAAKVGCGCAGLADVAPVGGLLAALALRRRRSNRSYSSPTR